MELEQISGELLVPGQASGRVLATDEPLSLWGGLDPESGEVIDRRHPLSGLTLAGRVLSLPFGRGSCSSSGVLLEAVSNGAGPVAIVVSSHDPVLGLGAILVDEILGTSLPVVLVAEETRRRLDDSCVLTVDQTGAIWVRRN